jgi:CelD/BcsL family acetyltransferase involved in cellulose biosynthesis
VRQFTFDHLLPNYVDFTSFIDSHRPSPFIDTIGGLDGYLGRASRSGRDNMGQARRRAAKAERELGPVRFEADIIDEKALQRLVELKRAQYASTGARDYFTDPRRAALLVRLLHTRDPEFAGILSTLYAGRYLLAAHFGIRSGPVLHWWFPVYDPVYAHLSPGWILLRELVAAAPSLGIVRIDLGRGDDEYKRRAKTGEILVSQGVVTRSNTRRVLRRTGKSIVTRAKSSPLAPGLRLAVRKFRDSTSEDFPRP